MVIARVAWKINKSHTRQLSVNATVDVDGRGILKMEQKFLYKLPPVKCKIASSTRYSLILEHKMPLNRYIEHNQLNAFKKLKLFD